MATLADIPPPAGTLGFAGVLPFVAGTVGFWALPQPNWAWLALEAQVFYGCVILSFLGAVHWGAVLAEGSEAVAEAWPRLGWSVTPALVGWMAALMNPAPALVTLMVGLGAAFVIDRRTVTMGGFPEWYGVLRRWLTAIALLSLGVSLIRLV
ncbi:MAG: DUF3429 domain-containing protein [Alphaproteobacteria bacterium]|nr:DUF3429 domain-containing protein [Alphaproteobacteria bacterium]